MAKRQSLSAKDLGAAHNHTLECSANLMMVPFLRTEVSIEARASVNIALSGGKLVGGGNWTDLCHNVLRSSFSAATPFLTNSCTAALEMAALLLDLKPGDEVIMPSWTFTSTANAVALRGATPVFVDVQENTLNIDPIQAERAITPKTRAICCVHYAGIACDMEALIDIRNRYGIALVEDAAQAYGATWHGQPLGGIGDFGALSFHGTKNVSSGEGGALIVNRPDLLTNAEVAWEKGTDRLQFSQGKVNIYQWAELGSSFLPSDLTAALLYGELQGEPGQSASRLAAWQRYDDELRSVDIPGLTLPTVPDYGQHNGHIYAIRLPKNLVRSRMIDALSDEGIDVRSHYQPLHLSKAGRKYCRVFGDLSCTEDAGKRLIRLPIFPSITVEEQAHVVRRLIALLCADA